MSYLVLARKWRPQTFADLVGQEHVAQTLKNAIAQGRIAHAFLFTGARGVGKTTIARVMAKALNCMNAQEPTPEPCAKCSACTEIARGCDTDVQEIDGASNNSVDDVRRLQESLPYLPQRDRFKVVIVDEVHMLSTGAFNALLKTLEEPPAHVKFIFATTEVHKVPVTILSRCQRYDFKLIPTQKIRERLTFILDQEGIAYDASAVSLVAREAAGSMRDALSLLDQVIAGAGPEGLKGTEAARLLGVADRAVLYDLARALLAGDAAAALRLVDTIAREGYDLGNVARNFLNLLRDLVVSKVVPDPGELLDLADEERADVAAITASADAADLERLFAAWSRTADEVARAREPRWVMEMALVRLSHRPPLVPIDELIARLSELEKRLGAPDTRGPSPGGGAPRSGALSPGGGPGGARPATQPGTTGALRFHPSEGGPSAMAPARAHASAPVADVAPARSASAQPTGLARAAQLDPKALSETSASLGSQRPAAPSARPAALREDQVDISGAADALDAWQQVLAAMDKGPLGVLEHAVPLEVRPECVRIAFETGSFYARKVANGEVSELIATGAAKIFGVRPTVQIVQSALPEDAPTLVRRKEQRRAASLAAREAAAREHPFVRRFLELVGGEIRQIKLDERD